MSEATRDILYYFDARLAYLVALFDQLPVSYYLKKNQETPS